MVNQLFLWPFWIAFCMFFGGSDPGYPKVAPGWPRHPPPRWASSFPGVPCLHVYTHIPYNCWWYHWYPRKNLWNSMNLCLPRLLQSPFFCSSICHQSQTMFDDATTNTWRFPSGPSQVSSEHTHWGHGGGGGGRWNQCGNWNLSGPPWCNGAGHRWANQQNCGRTHIPKLMRILAQFSMYLEGLGIWVSGDHHQLSLTSLRW